MVCQGSLSRSSGSIVHVDYSGKSQGRGEESLHLSCARWCSGVSVDKESGNCWGVEQALIKAEAKKCYKCKKFNAVIKCAYKQCKKMYHYECALDVKCLFDEDRFVVKCPAHIVQNFNQFIKDEYNINEDVLSDENSEEDVSIASSLSITSSNSEKVNQQSSSESSEENIFIVEKILGHKPPGSKRSKKTKYHVKWKGYSIQESSWEPESSFIDKTSIEDYWKSLKKVESTPNPVHIAGLSQRKTNISSEISEEEKSRENSPYNSNRKRPFPKEPIPVQLSKRLRSDSRTSELNSETLLSSSDIKQDIETIEPSVNAENPSLSDSTHPPMNLTSFDGENEIDTTLVSEDKEIVNQLSADATEDIISSQVDMGIDLVKGTHDNKLTTPSNSSDHTSKDMEFLPKSSDLWQNISPPGVFKHETRSYSRRRTEKFSNEYHRTIRFYLRKQ